MAHDTLARLRLWLHDLWNQRRESIIEELLDHDCEVELAGPVERLDRDGFRAHWSSLLTAFPDLHLESLSSVGDEYTGSVHWRAVGTHGGAWRGIPATRAIVRFSGASILDFRGHHAIRVHDLWDRQALTSTLHDAWRSRWARAHGLTSRQYEVATLMADRFTHVEIARRLEIRPNTARRHCEAVMLKLGVHRRADVEALLWGARTVKDVLSAPTPETVPSAREFSIRSSDRAVPISPLTSRSMRCPNRIR